MTIVLQRPLKLKKGYSSRRRKLSSIKFEEIFSSELLADDPENLKSLKIVSFEELKIKVQIEFK